MSIRLNHPDNTVTSSNTLSFTVEGGTPQAPRPIRFNSNSIVVPVKPLPSGESGALVFDSSSRTLKYHNGTEWIELLSKSQITGDLSNQIADINNRLNTKVDSVTYTTSAVPSASISGTTLNIVFPSNSGSGPSGQNGMFTSTRPGSIMQYALSSGQNVSSIREQLGGFTGSQAGRNGSSTAPYVTKDGWCLADGSYWTWVGSSGTITKIVPNLNRDAYLKGINLSGITKTDSPIPSSGSLTPTSFTLPDHYHGTGMMLGTSGDYGDDGYFIYGKTWNDGIQYYGTGVFGDAGYRETRPINGSNTSTALSTTLPIYPAGESSTITHNHTLQNVDTAHFNVAMLYNIAEPSYALPAEEADRLYLKKAGDSMQGPLTVLEPQAANNPATKSYVDNAVAGAAKSYALPVGAVNIPSGSVYTFGVVNVTPSPLGRLMRISLPVMSLDTDGDGGEPGFNCYIRINGVNKLSNVVWIPNDKYGNGLSYSWTPMITTNLPANVTQVQVGVQIDIINTMKNPRCADGAIWIDVV